MALFDRFRQPETRALTSEGVRDPQAATQQLSYVSAGMRQIPEWNADAAIREAYLSSVVVYAAVKTRAFAFSGCPLRAVLPGKPVESHDPNAPLAKLFGPAPGAPNSQFSSRKMWANAVANKIITGQFAWELEKPQGAKGESWAPVAAWPLISRAFYPIPTDGGAKLFSGFKYGRADRQVLLTPDQVFYVFDPSLNDMRQASSALQSARYDITADVLQSIYDVAFLRNDGRPAGILVHEAFEEASQTRAFKQQFEANHRGAQNANRMAFAETTGTAGNSNNPAGSAMHWINMGLSQRDAQMLAVHNDKANRICIALSVPMSLLDASGRTFNNAGMEERNFWLDTVMPDLRDMEDEINAKIAPRLGPHIAVFDTSHVASLQAPTKFMATKIEDLVDRKIITPLEARNEMGYPGEFEGEPLDTGATLLENATIIDKLVAAGWSPQEAAVVCGMKPPKAQEVPDPKPTAFATLPGSAPLPPSTMPNQPPTKPTSTSPPPPKPPQAGAAHAASLSVVRTGIRRSGERKRLWQQTTAHNTAMEAAWEKGLRRLFARQLATTLKRLDARKARWAKRDGEDIPPEDIFDPTFWAPETEQALVGLYESIYAAGGAQVAGIVGMTYNLNDPRVEAQITQRASALAGSVTDTTFKAIQGVIQDGIRQGWGIPQIATGIEDVFAQADSYRASLIARTETIRASADGAMTGWDQAVRDGLIDPTQYGKVWLADAGSRTCPECDDLNGETVRFDEQFSNGEDGPPDHPACRCSIGVDTLDDTSRGLVAHDHASIVLEAIAAHSLTALELTA